MQRMGRPQLHHLILGGKTLRWGEGRGAAAIARRPGEAGGGTMARREEGSPGDGRGNKQDGQREGGGRGRGTEPARFTRPAIMVVIVMVKSTREREEGDKEYHSRQEKGAL